MTITLVTLIRVNIEVEGPWAVGGVQAIDSTVGQPVLVDPRTRRPFIPATSLVGSLRRHLGDLAEAWLGPLPHAYGQAETEDDPRPRIASPLRALGVTTGLTLRVGTRASTAIEAARRAASGRTLRTEQLVETDSGITHLMLHLTHAGTADDQLLDRLRSWAPFLGRRRTAGYGGGRVVRVQELTIDLDDPRQLTWWLDSRDAWFDAGTGPPGFAVPEPRNGTAVHPEAALTFDWQVVDPLHIGTGKTASEAGRPGGSRRSAEPQEIARDASGFPVVHGTAWKGIFRHRCEYILTVCAVPERDQIVNLLFGYGGIGGDDASGQRGILRFGSSRITNKRRDVPVVRTQTHVAIDRVTAGASDRMLYRLKHVPSGRLTLHIYADRPLAPAVKTLLGHVARDLHDGLIGIGAGTTRGYGGLGLRGASALADLPAIEPQALAQFAAEVMA